MGELSELIAEGMDREEIVAEVAALEQQVDWLEGEYKWLWTKLRSLEQQVEELEKVALEAERIANEAHLAADNYAYDLMRTVLRPLVGNMEMSVAQALAQQEE